MSDHTIIDSKHIDSKQSEQYGDTRYYSIIRAKHCGGISGVSAPCLLTEDEAKQLARMFVHNGPLKRLTPIDLRKGKSAEWHVLITIPWSQNAMETKDEVT